jgi:hypothetical protein
MKEKGLKRLIERYYNGESTEADEKALRDHFRQIDIPEEYESEKDIFSYYTASGKIPEPSRGFEDRIIAGIDAYDNKTETHKIRKYLLPLSGVAAGLLILIGSYFFILQRSEPTDTFKDPRIAYAETMKVLLNVSSQLNHGTQALEPVAKINEMTTKGFESINRSTKIIEKSLKNLDYIRKGIEIAQKPVDRTINK